MNIKIIAVGKLKEKYLKDAVNEYMKRLSAYAKVEVIEIADEKEPDNASAKDIEIIKNKEGSKILDKIKEREYVILLDVEGKLISSEDLAGKIAELSLSGDSNLVFVIGGSNGVSEEVRAKADFKLSFSKMTFPHQLMRIILLEQIYRGFKINRGESYHK
jgi:23S rRNA (pseudouridine1915-N3)-methyltransferase